MARLTPAEEAELRACEAFLEAEERRRESLYDFIPRISPQFAAPYHLAPLVDAIERARAAARGEGPPVFVCSSVPPQCGKTESILHAIAGWVHKQPTDFLAYLSYNSEIAETKSRFARDYARLAGVTLRDDTNSVKTWRTPEGGGLMARGLLGGAITGQSDLKCLFIDDPYKRESDALSRVLNEQTFTAFRSSVWSRLHERTSVFVNHTRWHESDLQGRILADPDLGPYFERINIPIINEAGESLWPEHKPLSLIERLRAGSTARQWWSLYMGEPRPAEGRLFDGVRFYQNRPPSLRKAIGVDLAYSSKKSADWNVAVVLGSSGDTCYVLDVVRRQCTSVEWSRELLALQRLHPGAPMRAYVGGTEKGTIDFLMRDGVRITALPATADKLVRATGVAAAWELGKLLVPEDESATWREPFLRVVQSFTGAGDAHDDDVDALAAAYDALAMTRDAGVVPIQSFAARERRDPALRNRRGSLGAW